MSVLARQIGMPYLMGDPSQEYLRGAFGAVGKFADAYGNMYSSQAQNAGQGAGQVAQAYAQNTGALTQGMSGLGNSYAGAYGGLAAGLGNLAQAQANERSNFYTSNAMVETARQNALSNMSTAALAGYSGAANSAMGAWAQNQNAYNQALTGLGQSNQTGLSAYGASRNAALGQMAKPFSDLGGKLAAAGAIGNLNLGGAGGSFNASGPGGPVASGTYGGGGGGGASFAPNADSAYAGLNSLREAAMAGDITGGMNANLREGYNRLDAQHMSSRDMPSQMLGQTLSGLMALGNRGYGEIRGGMNQFYGTQNDPRNRGDYSGILASLTGGYRDALGSLSPLAGRMSDAFEKSNTGIGGVSGQLKDLMSGSSSNYGQAMGALGGLFENSLGKLGLFKTPLELAKQDREVDLYNRRNQLTDQLASLAARQDRQADWSRRNLQTRLDAIPMM